EGVFLQLVKVFSVSTLGSALTEFVGEFRHRFFGSLFFCFGRLRCCFLILILIGLRSGLRTRLHGRLGFCDWICDLLALGNKNPQEVGLLVRGFVLLVIIGDIVVSNLLGIRLQRATQLLGENLHAGIMHLLFEGRQFVEAAFFR